MAKRNKHEEVLPLFSDAQFDVPKERLARAYSADEIISGRVRDVIPINGKHYVCTGILHNGRKPNGCRNAVYYMHEVVQLDRYPGKAVKYGESRIVDRVGYVGVTVKFKKAAWVIVSDDNDIEITVEDGTDDLKGEP